MSAGRRHALGMAPLAAGLLVVVAVGLWWAPEVRHLLKWSFPGVPDEPAAAATILLANVRAGAGILAATLVLDHARRHGRGVGPLRTVLDVLLALSAARTGLLIAAALGAYGTRMALALLPHGPVELSAFALLASLYARARHAPVAPGTAVRRCALALALLVIAAALETFA